MEERGREGDTHILLTARLIASKMFPSQAGDTTASVWEIKKVNSQSLSSPSLIDLGLNTNCPSSHHLCPWSGLGGP